MFSCHSKLLVVGREIVCFAVVDAPDCLIHTLAEGNLDDSSLFDVHRWGLVSVEGRIRGCTCRNFRDDDSQHKRCCVFGRCIQPVHNDW
jgi:hypothetical protein